MPDSAPVSRNDDDHGRDPERVAIHPVILSGGSGTLPRRVHRPWGFYDDLDMGARFRVKRITVNPGAQLSLQLHQHRSEHWMVVSGTAHVTCGEETKVLHENQRAYIPVAVRHRIENPGPDPLEIIEVQCGGYLGEDDIVRFEDAYHRV